MILQNLNDVEKAISNPERGKAGKTDRLSTEISKDGGPVLAVKLTENLAKIWELNLISFDPTAIRPSLQEREKILL